MEAVELEVSKSTIYPSSHDHGSVENGVTIWKVTILLEGPIFHFHNYGRKGKKNKNSIYN